MNRTKEQARRFVKYWRVRYQQASSQERLFLGLFMLIVVYMWWLMALS
ncbi:MAG: hypothetical protein AB1649_20170 [Chloroflexota bacterium]